MEQIRSVADKVASLLSHSCDYKETNFHKLFAQLINNEFGNIDCEVVVPFHVENFYIGSGRLDCLTRDRDGIEFLIEIKACRTNPNLMKNHRGQVRKYLRHYRNPDAIGVLIVFNLHGSAYVEIIS